MLDQPPTHDQTLTIHQEGAPAPAVDADEVAPVVTPRATVAGRHETALSGQRSAVESLLQMAQLLVSPQPLAELWPQMLAAGLALLPGARRVELVTIEQPRPLRLRHVASAERNPATGAIVTSQSGQSTTSLSLGMAVDAQLRESLVPIHLGAAHCYPLVAGSRVRLGALVVVAERLAGGFDERALALAGHLTVLVERAARERATQREQGVAYDAVALTTSSPRPAPHAHHSLTATAGSVPQPDTPNAEQRVLAEMQRVLQTLVGAAVLVRRDDTVLTAAGGMGTALLLSANDYETVGALLADGGAHPMSIHRSQRAAWRALMPARRALARRLGQMPDSVSVLAVRVGPERVALAVLAEPPDAPDHEATHALATVVAALAGASIQVERLHAQVESQGQAQDTFLSLAAHELRSPLTSVKGYAQLLLRQAHKGKLPEQITHSAVAIEQQAVRMSELIDALHDSARIRRGIFEVTPAPMDLVALVEQQIEHWRTLHPHHTITLAAEAEALPGHWDAPRTTQVIGALLDNAARYSRPGSTIALRLARQENDALVSVRDQGMGVAPQDAPHIFAYLYRSAEAESRNLSGLGLGLFLASAFIERMGGRLWLQPTEGEPAAHAGSEFRFTLPLTTDEPQVRGR